MHYLVLKYLKVYTKKSFVFIRFFFVVYNYQNEAVSTLKKAKQQYFQRCDELEKAKASSAKAVDDTAGVKTLDKRRKSKDEAKTKVHVLSIQCINKLDT